MSPKNGDAGASGWPALARCDENHDHKICILRDAKAILAYAAPQTGTQEGKTARRWKSLPPTKVETYFKFLVNYLEQETRVEVQGDDFLRRALERFGIIANNDTQTSKRRNTDEASQGTGNTRSYAGVTAAGLPTPSRAPTRLTSSPPAPTVTSKAACEIRVKINNAEDIKKLRKQSKAHLQAIKTANSALEGIAVLCKLHQCNGAWSTAMQSRINNNRFITSADITQNGDMLLYAAEPQLAERVKHAHGQWEKAFGDEARVQFPMYEIVISSVPTNTNLSQQEQVIKEIQTENSHICTAADIGFVRWLTKPKKDKMVEGLVVAFKDPREANAFIEAERVVFDGRPKKVQRYSRDCQITQCFRCHAYGHKASMCTQQEKCGYCSSKEHATNDHPDRHSKSTKLKCPCCGEKHAAWSKDCKHRKSAVKNVVDAKQSLLENPLFPVDVTFTPTPSQSGSVNSATNRSTTRASATPVGEDSMEIDALEETSQICPSTSADSEAGMPISGRSDATSTIPPSGHFTMRVDRGDSPDASLKEGEWRTVKHAKRGRPGTAPNSPQKGRKYKKVKDATTGPTTRSSSKQNPFGNIPQPKFGKGRAQQTAPGEDKEHAPPSVQSRTIDTEIEIGEEDDGVMDDRLLGKMGKVTLAPPTVSKAGASQISSSSSDSEDIETRSPALLEMRRAKNTMNSATPTPAQKSGGTRL